MSTPKAKQRAPRAKAKVKSPSAKELKVAQDKIENIDTETKKPIDYKTFRRALNLARGNEHKISKFKGKSLDVEFILVDANGAENPFLLTIHLKRLYRGDYERYNDQQFAWEDNDGVELKDPKRVMSRYTSAVIVACADSDGNRLFSSDDVEMLESPLNIINVMKLSGRIINILGLTESADALEKPE